ncbi:MAG: DNA polymerase Y family protein [Candidatus Eremiobacteraeota bacterium]|nr:DNA polymerase Y family protein [Candidatus Eremiobacteraeota bacterium]
MIISNFSSVVCVRANPSLAARPLAVAEGAQRRTIVDASADAIGVRTGMTPKQARAACPHLTVVARDEAAERSVSLTVLEALELCGPDAEGAAPGLYYFDAAGQSQGTARVLERATLVIKALGLKYAAAAASDKFSARCAALVSGGVPRVIAPHESAAFLAPLPITLLPLAPGDADRFSLLGLRTLRHIAALPAGPLAARFGERARAYARLARGDDDEPLYPHRTPAVYESRFAFDDPVERLDSLLFALRGCFATVADRLAGSAQACDRVEVVLEREGSAQVFVPVALAEPTASAAGIFDVARIALESREALGCIAAVAVRAKPCDRSLPQMLLFDGSRGSRRAALAATLARLHAALERDGVITMEADVSRSRLPERMQRATPLEAVDGVAEAPARPASPILPAAQQPAAQIWAPALRLLDPPRRIEEPADNAARAGPFRFSESWWERPVERDYYQVADPRGALMLVFRDLRDGLWYMQGTFD